MVRRTVPAAGAAIILGLGALATPPLLDRVGGALVERQALRLIGALPGVTVGALRAEAAGGRIVVEDAVFSGPGTRVTVGRLVLPVEGGTALGLVRAARAEANTVSADNIRIASGATTVLIPHIEAQGTSLTADELKAIFDPARPMPAAERLAKLSAASLKAPEVSILPERKDPAKTAERITFRNVALADVVAGRIGTLAIAGMTTSTTDGTAVPDTTVEVGRIGATALDLPLALQIATGSRTDAAAPTRTVYDSLSVENLRIAGTNPTGDMRIAAITSGGLRARPLLDSFDHIEAMSKRPAAERTDAERAHLSDIVRDALHSAALDRFEIRDFAFSQTGTKTVDVKLGRFALDGLEAVKYGKVSLDGFSMAAQGVTVSMGQFSVGGYDQSALLEALVDKMREPGPVDISTYAPRYRPSFDTAAMLGLHVEAPAEGGTGNSPDGQHHLVDMPAFTIANTSNGAAVATSAHVQVVYAVPPNAADPNLRAIAKAGVKTFDVSSDYALNYDAGQGEIRLDKFAVEAKDLARVTLGGRVANVTADLFAGKQDPEIVAAAAQKIVLRGLSLDIADTGLAAKALPLLAASAGTSVPIMKAQLKGQAEVLVLQGLGQTPAAKRVTAALARFIDDPRTLRLSLTAPKGLSVAEIAASESPQALLDRVEIDAVANR